MPGAFGLLPSDLHALVPAATARDCRRALAHLIAEGRPDLAALDSVGKRARAAIGEAVTFDRPAILERVTDDSDGFVKYLLRLSDGALTEVVRIPLHKPGHYSLCLSSQVGCAMKCDFCATGRQGFRRNLDAHEIVGSFLAVRADTPGRVTGAVFMGQGEPFHNYERVIQAARVLSDPCGARVDGKNITISTVGLVPQIRRYTEEGWKFRLIVSLTTSDPQLRARLLPVASSLARFDELVDAIKAHARSRPGRTTVAWVLLGGLNHDAAEGARLRDLFDGVALRVNLIDVNDARPDGYRRATDEERARFMSALQVLNAPIVRRYSGGSNRHAACGMLASQRLAESG
jgi:23S rRNA (adenine2503-C2)-methyltransferase